MAVGVPGEPGTDTVVRRGSSFVDVRYGVSAGKYDPLIWLINPDLAPVAGVPNWYWKTVADTVVEQDAAEKAATDAAIDLRRRSPVIDFNPSRPINPVVLRKFLVNAGFPDTLTVTPIPDPIDPLLATAVRIQLPAIPNSEQLATLAVYVGVTYVRPPAYMNPCGRSPNGTIWRMAVTDAGLLSTTVIP
jgi:hypothetical protein